MMTRQYRYLTHGLRKGIVPLYPWGDCFQDPPGVLKSKDAQVPCVKCCKGPEHPWTLVPLEDPGMLGICT